MTTQTNIQPVIQRFEMNKNTVSSLKSMTPNFGFNGLGELVFRRTYSRDNEDWADVVIRVVNGCMSIRKDHFYKHSLEWNDDKWQEFASKMAHSLFNMEWLPPGRGLWMMGTDFTYHRGSMSLYNCFKADTKFWTSEGLKSFQDFQDGEAVIVRGNKKWVNATVKCFGEQKLWKLTIQKESVQDVIYTTEGHRWLIKQEGNDKYDFKVKTTSELETNWELQSFAKRTNFRDMEICPTGKQHGTIFGNSFKDLELNNCETCSPSIWKNLPSLTMNKEYLLGFLSGWFASNGYMNENSNMSLSNNNIKVLEAARDIFFKLDITCGPIESYNSSYHMSINMENIPEKFFFKDSHVKLYTYTSKINHWKVVNVEPTDIIEHVWCVVEPEHEEFTLENGILTKNCAATDTTHDVVHAAEWTMDCLMNGVGVGFNTLWRGKLVKPDKQDTEVYVIPDSREGWVTSLIKLMCSYIDSPKYGKNKFPVFDYSLIREKGLPIKGFGGTASGPEPLKDMHNRIEGYLDALSVGRLQCKSKTYKEVTPGDWQQVEVDVDKPYSHTRFIADVFNAIGACVVAG